MNLSQIKREKMMAFLKKLKEENSGNEENLIAINEIENELNNKKYGLIWEEHEENVDKMMEDNVPVFVEDKKREIKTNEDEYNFLLEGDNLHSLYLLEKTHKGKIDVIYIDPPYNTGSEDFKYDDSYINEDDCFRHSKWISFMYKRLCIASELLSEKGCIFIQISDIELAQLKLLCDEVFGQDNFINVISVKMKNIAGVSGGGEDKRLKKNCEYILVYAKNYSLVPLFNKVYDYKEIYDLVEEYRKNDVSWKYTSVLVFEGEKEYLASTVDGDGNEIKIYNRINPIIKSINKIANDEGISEKEVYYKYGNKIFMTAMPQSSIRPRVMEKLKELNINTDFYSIEYVPKTGKNKGKVYEQFYKGDKSRLLAWLKDVTEEIDGVLYKKEMQGTYWDMTEFMNNLTKEGNIEFKNGKKPTALLKRIIDMSSNKNINILDFFAGSGTTGQAVLELNSEDKGNRHFILCTNNENDICEKITFERLKNVICGYETGTDKHMIGIPANLKYYKTDFVKKDTKNLSRDLSKHVKELIQLENGVDIDNDNWVMILTEEDAEKFEKNINKYKNLKGVYRARSVVWTKSQKVLLKGKEDHIIPDYYFNNELKEVGENW